MTEPKVLTQTATLTEQEWLEYRRKGIGGSDCACVCGISRWKSPIELWLEKTGQSEPKPAGESAYWGTLMEPLLKEEFTKRTGLTVKTVQSILMHPEYDFMLANIDGIVIDPDRGKCVFEAKTANAFAKSEWDGGEVPPEYYLQLQHYLAVTGMPAAYIAVLIGGNKFMYKVIERDEDTIEMLIQLEAHFWFQVTTRSRPTLLDGSAAVSDFIDRLYSKSQKTSIILPADADLLVKEYLAGKDAEEAAKTQKQSAENRLKDMLQEHEQGITPAGAKITWKTVNSSRIDSKKLKADLPEIAAQYTTESSSRRFIVAP